MSAVADQRKHWEDRVKAKASAMVSAGGATGCVSAPERRAAAGLVPSKTSGNLISFAPSIVAERRVKRLKKAVWASGHLHGVADHGFRPPVCWFVTLTYAKAHAWAARHVSEAIRAYRGWCKRKGLPCRYTWVAEIQPQRFERTGDSVVHYHLLAWLPHGVNMPFWDQPTRKRAPFWPHGMSNTQPALAGVGYLMKYLSKLGELTKFPKGLRLYGIGGLDEQARQVRVWFNLPEWVKSNHGVGDAQRFAGGIWSYVKGEWLEPAYSCKLVAGVGMVMTVLRELPERFHDGAYSSFPRAIA